MKYFKKFLLIAGRELLVAGLKSVYILLFLITVNSRAGGNPFLLFLTAFSLYSFSLF